VTIKQFDTEKITTNITIPRTKILMTSIVASILITGMIFMSSPQVFAHNLNTEVMIEFDNSTPTEGDIVAMTGTVMTSFTNGGGGGHNAIDQVDIDFGKGRIQQGVDGDDNPVSDCESTDHYEKISEDNPVTDGEWTHNFDTTGLAGQTLVFRAQYVTGGGGHTVATAMSECLELEIGGDPFDGFKTWTHTDYNWQFCDGFVNPEDHLCYEEDTFDTQKDFETANINNPDHDVLADSLDLPTEDGISDVLLQVKENGEISNMNPGAIYALTTVNVLANLDMLEVVENYADCTDTELELLNQNNPSRNVKVAVAGPNGDVTEVTDRLYDTEDDGVEFIGDPDNNSATVKINDASLLTDGSTVFVLVKFDDKLKGVEFDSINGGEPFTCLNDEMVSSIIGEGDPFELTFEATLRFTEAQ